jgi:D-methionine transport system permease protein
MYGFARRNEAVLYTSTVIIVLIVFAIQWAGDALVKKVDKR